MMVKERRSTAFVVELDCGGGANNEMSSGRRLPRPMSDTEPLSRYVPPSVERSSARRHAHLVSKKLRRKHVSMSLYSFSQ